MPTYRHRRPEPGRNSPCYCKSGLKYKMCCGRQLTPEQAEERFYREQVALWDKTAPPGAQPGLAIAAYKHYLETGDRSEIRKLMPVGHRSSGKSLSPMLAAMAVVGGLGTPPMPRPRKRGKYG